MLGVASLARLLMGEKLEVGGLLVFPMGACPDSCGMLGLLVHRPAQPALGGPVHGDLESAPAALPGAGAWMDLMGQGSDKKQLTFGKGRGQ